MIDCFALLKQPRAPWLDPASLKEAYHRQTLQTHPDTAARDNPQGAFAELNEAYQVLQDPKRRLYHLLELEGRAPSSGDQTVPLELHDLFPAIGDLAQRANLFLETLKAASNALSRSLLKPELLELQKETAALREKIQALSNAALAELRVANSSWGANPSEGLATLSNLYFTFAYLGRWSAQLDEIAFQLSLH
jgi:curved DNA-binding protein CbpA